MDRIELVQTDRTGIETMPGEQKEELVVIALIGVLMSLLLPD